VTIKKNNCLHVQIRQWLAIDVHHDQKLRL
jgi:hypothetical protein